MKLLLKKGKISEKLAIVREQRQMLMFGKRRNIAVLLEELTKNETIKTKRHCSFGKKSTCTQELAEKKLHQVLSARAA